MYCPECGYKIDEEDAMFCPECGEKIGGQEVQASRGADVGAKEEMMAYGIILTNVRLLALKLGVDEEALRGLLEDYVEAKRAYGVSYQLADAGHYTYRKRNLLGMSKTVRLGADNEVWDYMEILMDIHRDEQSKSLPESQYLFIIGGDDVIPMPCVQHYVKKNVHDKTIDTDILYAYPYGSDMLPLLENQQIFKYDQLFFVGRLPVGEDTSMEELCGYLQRSLDCSYGIPLGQAYGQCDPNWKNVSATVSHGLLQRNLFRNFDGRLPDDFYFRRLILSPMVTVNDVQHIFHTQASLYYFNLHGGDAMESRGYFGAPLHQRGTYPVLLPEHLATCQVPNVVACEACYGARFIEMDKHHSMLLTALYTATLLFVGSSRVAWGNVDPTSSSSGYTPVQPALADVMAMGFMEALLSGYSAGQAMFLARGMVLQQDEEGTPHTAATIIEFNLYGDPTLGMAVAEDVKSSKKAIDKEAGKVKTPDYGCVVEKVDALPGADAGSILGLVRGMVDDNIARIHDMVGRHLYAQYGIEPRPASGIFKLSYANGSKELNFHYDVSPDPSMPMEYIVRTTERGDVKSVITTR